jgi:hypothetical protein
MANQIPDTKDQGPTQAHTAYCGTCGTEVDEDQLFPVVDESNAGDGAQIVRYTDGAGHTLKVSPSQTSYQP